MEDLSEMSPLLLRVEQVVELLNLSRCGVYDLIRTGELRSVKIGGLRRVPVSAVQEYVDRLASEAA